LSIQEITVMPRVLRDIMTKYVVTIDANGTALEAAMKTQ
jgi:CBS domain-containing protein